MSTRELYKQRVIELLESTAQLRALNAELLAALKSLVDWHIGPRGGADDWIAVQVSKAQAAIAKAEAHPTDAR